jgi:hypothetical protein
MSCIGFLGMLLLGMRICNMVLWRDRAVSGHRTLYCSCTILLACCEWGAVRYHLLYCQK